MADRDASSGPESTQPWDAISRYLGRMFLRLGARSHDAEDLTQESLARVVGRPDAPRCPPSFALATTVGRNLWRDRLRRKIRRGSSEGIEATESMADGGATPADTAAEREDVLRLRDALELLDPRHKNAIVLVILQHKTYDQAAKILGVPRGTVKSRIHYGITHLRARLSRPDAGLEGGDAAC